MAPPFSAAEFFGVFVAYNQAVWPAQIALNLLALGVVALAFLARERAHRAIALVLGSLWLWTAVAYHWMYFAEINPAARAFAAAFALEGALLGWLALRPAPLRFRPRADRYGLVGGALMIYALALYPVIAVAMGHAYPAQPTFGLPCPTTIFTIGMLLWASPRVPWGVLVIPAAWSLLGLSAVGYFGVIEDAMLPVAGVLGSALILLKNRGTRAMVLGRGAPATAR
jgi:hypothetical protein